MQRFCWSTHPKALDRDRRIVETGTIHHHFEYPSLGLVVFDKISSSSSSEESEVEILSHFAPALFVLSSELILVRGDDDRNKRRRRDVVVVVAGFSLVVFE